MRSFQGSFFTRNVRPRYGPTGPTIPESEAIPIGLIDLANGGYFDFENPAFFEPGNPLAYLNPDYGRPPNRFGEVLETNNPPGWIVGENGDVVDGPYTYFFPPDQGGAGVDFRYSVPDDQNAIQAEYDAWPIDAAIPINDDIYQAPLAEEALNIGRECFLQLRFDQIKRMLGFAVRLENARNVDFTREINAVSPLAVAKQDVKDSVWCMIRNGASIPEIYETFFSNYDYLDTDGVLDREKFEEFIGTQIDAFFDNQGIY